MRDKYKNDHGGSRHRAGGARALALQGRPMGEVLARATPELTLLYGWHSVREALENPARKVLRLHAAAGAAAELEALAAQRKIPLAIVTPQAISATLPRDAVHQNVLLECRPLPDLDLADIESKSGIVLVLDQITDPHNVGAIIRTAAAFNVDALVMTDRNAPEMSGALAKAASGGLELVPIVRVVNLARALRMLADSGAHCIGLDSDAPETLVQAASGLGAGRSVALVLGAEGEGLRRLTRETCDVMARLDLPGQIISLNVSNACALALAAVHQALNAHP